MSAKKMEPQHKHVVLSVDKSDSTRSFGHNGLDKEVLAFLKPLQDELKEQRKTCPGATLEVTIHFWNDQWGGDNTPIRNRCVLSLDDSDWKRIQKSCKPSGNTNIFDSNIQFMKEQQQEMEKREKSGTGKTTYVFVLFTDGFHNASRTPVGAFGEAVSAHRKRTHDNCLF